jgi:hypothetical protein
VSVRSLAFGSACAVLALAAGSCSIENGAGYIEIKAVPQSPLPQLYLDAVKLEPLRNGSALLQHKVGTSKLQIEGEGGYLAVLCTIDVRKNRITSVTISAVSRQPRCQCGRSGGADATGSRTCIG